MLAITPVAALMFRFNNPDALLVLLLVAGAYCLVRALERAGTRWIVAAGALIGFAFLAKMLQAFLVLPGVRARLPGGGARPACAGGVWQTARRRRGDRGQRRLVGGARRAVAGRLAADDRRLVRQQHPQPDHRLQRPGPDLRRRPGGGGGGGGGANFSGATGMCRLFNDLMGGQASWLLPAALLALVAGLWSVRRAPRTDRTRAALLLWGGWLIVTGLVFSFGRA